MRVALAIVLTAIQGAACSGNSSSGTDAGSRDALVADRATDQVAPPDQAAPDLAAPDTAIDGGPTGTPPAIDGLFDDWEQIDVLATDDAGDATGGFDVTTVKVTSRATVVYLHFDVGAVLNASSGPVAEGTLRIELSLASGRRLTVDLRQRKAWTDGDPAKTLRWRELDYLIAPTFAADRFEARLDLAAIGAKLGDTVMLELNGSDGLDAPASFKLSAPAQAEPTTGDPTRAPGATLRIASLNTLLDGLSDPLRGPPLGRLLKATAADVICLQEVFEASAESIETVLTALDPAGDGASWTAHKAGDVLVATRGTLVPLQTQQQAMQRHVAAAIEVDGRAMVVFTLRPSCCGAIGGIEDAARIVQMKIVAETIKKLRAGDLGAEALPYQQTPVIVVGDWNLVGSRAPLDVMLDKTTGPGLVHHWLRHLRGDEVFTWHGDKIGAFPPGMLDLLVHSPELSPKRGFVLDTTELEPSTLSTLGLEAADSQGSDHLLLVADF